MAMAEAEKEKPKLLAELPQRLHHHAYVVRDQEKNRQFIEALGLRFSIFSDNLDRADLGAVDQSHGPDAHGAPHQTGRLVEQPRDRSGLQLITHNGPRNLIRSLPGNWLDHALVPQLVSES